MKFTKTGHGKVTLESNGTRNDGLKLANWARNLITSCNVEIVSSSQKMALSANHLNGEYAPDEIKIEFSNYFANDLSFWLRVTKS